MIFLFHFSFTQSERSIAEEAGWRSTSQSCWVGVISPESMHQVEKSWRHWSQGKPHQMMPLRVLLSTNGVYQICVPVYKCTSVQFTHMQWWRSANVCSNHLLEFYELDKPVVNNGILLLDNLSKLFQLDTPFVIEPIKVLALACIL